jgi:hypothetical protein
VAAPESANNAATGGAFIPLLTLGIPTSATMAIFLGALVIYGTQPGPMLIKEHPNLFWGVVASMYLGNVMLLVLNLPLIGLWVKVLKIPYPILFPLILLFCLIGAYSLNNNIAQILFMICFGFLGYLFKKFQYEAAPLVLAFVLGPMLEKAFFAPLGRRPEHIPDPPHFRAPPGDRSRPPDFSLDPQVKEEKARLRGIIGLPRGRSATNNIVGTRINSARQGHNEKISIGTQMNTGKKVPRVRSA